MKRRGYPANTKCIVTWAWPENTLRIGEIVVVNSWTGYCTGPIAQKTKSTHLLSQGIEGRWSNSGCRLVYPVQWIRPLEDPDDAKRECVEQEADNTAALAE